MCTFTRVASCLITGPTTQHYINAINEMYVNPAGLAYTETIWNISMAELLECIFKQHIARKHTHIHIYICITDQNETSASNKKVNGKIIFSINMFNFPNVNVYVCFLYKPCCLIARAAMAWWQTAGKTLRRQITRRQCNGATRTSVSLRRTALKIFWATSCGVAPLSCVLSISVCHSQSE